ncbi:MAG: hypothetical protein FJ296_07730 [Planctomycetes bacterium]|nr:hypothetical protein [Planctomycetota bacterium]
MMRSILALALLAAAAAAQAPQALVFVMNDDGTTADFGAIAGQPSALGDLYDTTLVRFVPGTDASAAKVAGLPEWACLLGDEDGDFDFWEGIFDDLDALGLHALLPPPARLTSGSLILSCEAAFGGALESSVYDSLGACDGTLFRLDRAPGGATYLVHRFLTEASVLAAIGQLGQPDSDGVDVDAFAMDPDGNIYLSFRVNEAVNGTVLEDDGVLALPWSTLSWDSDLDVIDVVPGSAVIVLDALAVNTLVLHAGLKNASGNTITTLTDLQALELDPQGGSFVPVQVTPGLPAVPHLLFNGQTIGPVVLTTRNGGVIAALNGQPLGTTTLSGSALGLDPGSSSGATSDLNGLLVMPDSLPVPMLDVTDGEVDVHAAPEGATVEFLGAHFTPGAAALLLLDGWVPLGSPDISSVPVKPGLVYPDYYLSPFALLVPVVTDAAGRFRVSFTAPPLHLSYLVLAQAADVVRKELSSPALAWCP